MKTVRGYGLARLACSLSAAVLLLVAAGDRAARSLPPPGVGIDPFDVLDLQIKPNVLFALATAGSMQEDPPHTGNEFISGDDAGAKMYKAKQALNALLTAHAGKFNFGFASYNLLNSDKVLADAPLTYVTSTSVPGASIWSGGNGYFLTAPGTPYLTTGFSTNALDAEVYRSFARTTQAFPGPGCAAGVNCRVQLRSRLFRNGLKFKWSTTATGAAGQAVGVGTSDILTNISPISCASFPPPASLFPDDPPGMVRPCLQMENSAGGGSGRTTTFWYSGARFEPGPGGGVASCGGGRVLDNVAQCDVDNVPQVQRRLQLELPLWDVADPTANTNTCGGPRGAPCALQPAGNGTTAIPIVGTNPAVTALLDPDLLGVTAAQDTPLGGTLGEVLNTFSTTFPMPGGGFDSLQKHVVVLITDRPETCGTNPVDLASQLWNRNGNAPGQFAETFVIGFGLDAADQATLDPIACAGSGGTVSGCSGTSCTCTGGGRMTALSADDTGTLVGAVNGILAAVSAQGVFSTTPSVFDGILEYVDTVPAPVGQPPFDPLDPATRYGADANRSYRASFDTAGFKGFVHSFDSSGPVPGWEAGQKLLARVDPGLVGTDRTFREITTGGMIRRRIFTSARNGISPTNVLLWSPLGPAAAVAPNDYTTAGSLDGALFLKSDGTQMNVAELQAAPLFACLGANLPAGCLSATASTKLAAAKREAREMILAFTAGAEAVRDLSSQPLRNASGEILYRARSWILADSTLATPAVMTPPDSTVPSVHQAEYVLFRDGPRDANNEAVDAIDQGFGLRNPDNDGKEVPAGTLERIALKPVMSVVYVPANDMLHAFRAGPQCPTVASNPSCGGPELGGEELWGYVPYDQLAKLRERLKPQTRSDHAFMLASSLRFADVFVPGAFTLEGKSYTGRWRRVLLMGRGIGGKYYSALDVTSPGPFTRDSLSTNLPRVLWARGNPDTQDGTLTGARNGTNTEVTLYRDMGQSWSTPAVSRSSVFRGFEFVAYVGSGYGTRPNEGTRFYTLDVLTGSILASADVGDAAGPSFDNAIVADPAPYAPELLLAGVDLPHASGPLATAVYVGDIHGRMWKFKTDTATDLQTPLLFTEAGIDQPIGVGAALLNLGNAYVFFASGADARVPAPPSQFKVWAVQDENLLPGTIVNGFPVAFPAPGAGQGPYRGTVPPLTAFLGGTEGVVFFVGTRFNPIAPGRCASSFDSIVVGLFAKDATAAYDWSEYEGAKIVGMPLPPPLVSGPGVPGDVANPAPGETALPPPPVPEPQVGAPAVVLTRTLRPSSSVCRF